MDIKKKLNYFEKNLSVKHLGRDIILFELLIIISILVASILFLWIINHAVSSNNPQQVLEHAQTVSYYIKWIGFILMNVVVMFVAGKAKIEAQKTKEEIIKDYLSSGAKEK